MPYDPPVRGPAIKGATVAGVAATLVLFAWLAGRTGGLRPAADARAGAAWVLLSSGPWPLGWLAAATGLGWPVRRMFLRRGGYALQFCLGVAAMMTADAGLGALGLLQPAGGLGAWALVLVGFALLLVQLRREGPPRFALPWTAWAAAPAVAVLLAAACSAPGWLWSSEFGGYDALSYHLQLPKEWLALGAIRPLPHNVYSWLPGYAEAAYYHLAVLMGDGLGAVYACQLLHAGLTIASAVVTGLCASRLVGPSTAALCAAMFLGTPWAAVVGSLAYNEMAVALFLAGGLLLLDNDEISQRGRAIMIGLLAAAACGAKLTAAGFVAAPLAILLASTAPPRRWPTLLAAAAGAGALVLVPWLARKAAHCGNPVFPFATDLFGTAHWTHEQVVTWRLGHQPPGEPGARLGALWAQLFRYGIGPNRDPSEPWLPQWSLLPWLALAGLAGGAAFATGPRRWPSRLGLVLAVQVLFWLTMTHLKSRFMTASLVPMSLAAGLGLGAIQSRLRWHALTPGLAAAAFLWCCLPVAIFLRERGGAPAAMIDWADVRAGYGIDASLHRELAREIPAVYVNAMPPETRTLLIGDAAPLYYRGNFAYQTTWDRGPMSEAMRSTPDQPRWLATLRRQGFTHVLVEPHMLARWANEKWNDPLLTPDRVLGALEPNARLEQQFPGDVRLYRLPGGS